MAEMNRDSWMAHHYYRDIYPGDEDADPRTQTRGILDRFDRIWTRRHRRKMDYPRWWWRRADGDIVLGPSDPDSQHVYQMKKHEMLTEEDAQDHVKMMKHIIAEQRKISRRIEDERKAEENPLQVIAQLLAAMGVQMTDYNELKQKMAQMLEQSERADAVLTDDDLADELKRASVPQLIEEVKRGRGRPKKEYPRPWEVIEEDTPEDEEDDEDEE